MARGPGVRVIAGSLRGRRLVVPPGDLVRPTKDMVREAVFSALDARGALRGAVVLDLYSGSGALAIEALSRGAASAVLVEREASALTAIGRNLTDTGLTPVARVARADVATFLGGTPPPESPFGLVLADPPYDAPLGAVEAQLRALAAPGWLGSGALIVLERPARTPVSLPEGFRACWERMFGDTLVVFVDAFDPPT